MSHVNKPHGPHVNSGLCADCLHSRRVQSARGSVFVLCQLSSNDPSFAKYPPLPVLSCGGYEQTEKRISKAVVVVDYDPNWPGLFESLRPRIATSLGGLAQAIEHVGSTAVPGLAAKPVIDIDVLLRSHFDLPAAIGRLAELGYAHQGNLGIADRAALAAPSSQPAHHLYVCAPHSAEFRRHVALRDYLRTHTAEARSYGELKSALAARYAGDRAAYIEGKRLFLEELVERALSAQSLGRYGHDISNNK
jgi:GrpB-like predicted nucleotidyltransferase (UPF0157 family)